MRGETTFRNFLSEEDDQNWYVYVSNDPINRIDPLGLADVVNQWGGELILDHQYEGSAEQRREILMTTQNETRNNPAYQPNAGGPFNLPNSEGLTWCNQATFDVVDETGDDLSVLTGEESRWNRTANEATNSLFLTQVPVSSNANQMREVTALEAQRLANDGRTVVAAWYNTSGSGHLATVVPTERREFNPDLGPIVSQVGYNMGVMPVRLAFGSERMDAVRYFTVEKEAN